MNPKTLANLDDAKYKLGNNKIYIIKNLSNTKMKTFF